MQVSAYQQRTTSLSSCSFSSDTLDAPPLFSFFQAEDGIRAATVTGVQTCALPIAAGLGYGPAPAAGTCTWSQPACPTRSAYSTASTTAPPTATSSLPHPGLPRLGSRTSGSGAARSARRSASSPRDSGSCSSPRPEAHATPPRSSGQRSPATPTAWRRSRPSAPSWPPRPRASATVNCGSRPATSTTWSPAASSPSSRSTTPSTTLPRSAACWSRNPDRRRRPWPPPARSAWPTRAAFPTTPAPPPMLRPTSRPDRCPSAPQNDDHPAPERSDHEEVPPDQTRCVGWAVAPIPARNRATAPDPQEAPVGPTRTVPPDPRATPRERRQLDNNSLELDR